MTLCSARADGLASFLGPVHCQLFISLPLTNSIIPRLDRGIQPRNNEPKQQKKALRKTSHSLSSEIAITANYLLFLREQAAKQGNESNRLL